MAVIDLPALPRGTRVEPRLIDPGAMLKPPLGGATQFVGRLGGRFALDVVLPKLSQDCARAWIARRIRSRNLGDTLRLTWPQPPLAQAVGAPVVSGAGQTGSALICSGVTPGLTILEATFFSFSAGGRNYLHTTTSNATANGSGVIALPVGPMLRASPANGAAVEFAAPKIEGFVEGEEISWTLDRLRFFGVAFTLEEVE